MNLLQRLMHEDDGQGLVESTMVILLVTMVFWLGVRETNAAAHLATAWSKIAACVIAPASCTP